MNDDDDELQTYSDVRETLCLFGCACGYDLTKKKKKKSHKGISSLSFGTVEWKWNASPHNLRIYFLFFWFPGQLLESKKGGSCC